MIGLLWDLLRYEWAKWMCRLDGHFTINPSLGPWNYCARCGSLI